MPVPPNLRATGDRIEQLLDELGGAADPRSLALSEELLRLVSDLYGAGLARMVELASEEYPGFLKELAKDDLVASLLIVQGLHPEALTNRVEKALAQVRPLLAAHGGNVELLGLDAASNVIQLQLLGSCEGCPSSAVTLKMAVERAIIEAAPEVTRIEVIERPQPARSVPIVFGKKPLYEECPVGVAPA